MLLVGRLLTTTRAMLAGA